MITIDVKDDDKGCRSLIMDEQWRIVLALTRTARDAAQDIKEGMAQKFTLRNSWVQKGIRFDPASKDNPVARVYSIDPYMVKQNDGESYQPDGHVAIPWAARPTRTSLIPRSMFPKALRSNPSVFKGDFSKNPGSKLYPLVGLFQRVQGNRRLKILFLLKSRKATKPRWGFDEQVERAVGNYFTRNFSAYR